MNHVTRIQAIRTTRGLSLRDVAEHLRCTPGHLSRIERGEINASPEFANKLSEFFENEVSRDEILFPADYANGRKKPVLSAHAEEAR